MTTWYTVSSLTIHTREWHSVTVAAASKQQALTKVLDWCRGLDPKRAQVKENT